MNIAIRGQGRGPTRKGAEHGHVLNGREHLLVSAFVELADTLVDDYDVIDVLDRLVAHSVTLLAADAAGILLVDARGGCGSWPLQRGVRLDRTAPGPDR